MSKKIPDSPEDKRIIDDISWLPAALEAAEVWGLEPVDVEKIVRRPQHTVFDAYSNEVGYPVVKHLAGDVVVVTGYRERHHPMILSVFTNKFTGAPPKRTTGGGGGGSTLPRDYGDLMKKIKSMGYTITPGGHPKIVDPQTDTVIYSIPGTPSDHRSLANTWRAFLTRHQKWNSGQKQAALENLKKNSA